LWHASVLLSAGDRCLQYSIHNGNEQNELNCLADPFATYSGKMNLFGKYLLDILLYSCPPAVAMTLISILLTISTE